MLDILKQVRVKADRKCAMCGRTIREGSSCYTYSVKYKGRGWVCRNCYDEIEEDEMLLEELSYDDYYEW